MYINTHNYKMIIVSKAPITREQAVGVSQLHDAALHEGARDSFQEEEPDRANP